MAYCTPPRPRFLVALFLALTLGVGLIGLYFAKHEHGTWGVAAVTAALAYLGLCVAVSGALLIVQWIALDHLPARPTVVQELRHRFWNWL